MRRLILLTILCCLAGLLFAAHDFTINGVDEVWVSLGDTLHLEFTFEAVGNAADIAISLSAIGIEIPIYATDNAPLMDGLPPDETPSDGVFSMHLPNNFSLPEAAVLEITVTDDGVSDTAILHFEQLDSTYYLYGNVLQEGMWIDLPVPGALVYTFYNASLEEIQEMLENFELEAFLAWLAQDHYLLSELTGFLGGYELYVPDTIPDVTCTVGVLSALDLAGTFVAPDAQSVTVSGATEVDFLYLQPDGYLEGEVSNDAGDPLPGTVLTLTQPDNLNFFRIITADSLAAFSVPLVNGDYSLSAITLNYLPWQQDIAIAGSDVWVDVILEVDSPAWVHLETTVHFDNGDPVQGALLELTWLQYPAIVFSDVSDDDGLLDLDVPVGDFDLALSLNDVVVYTATISVTQSTQLDPIVIPWTDTDEDAVALRGSRLYPNPFNPQTTLSFDLATPAHVSVVVYDVRGRRVRQLSDDNLPAGAHSLLWNGLDEQGNAVGSGVYLLRLQSGDSTSVFKAALLK
ncbi:MAG: T9SS type A sorting domain-containing protein [Candidatus Cloacimonetes bacterium]|nr:T9SS type A sorting domain-containing protein [Candidatus Cloacimonadota bacterium]